MKQFLKRGLAVWLLSAFFLTGCTKSLGSDLEAKPVRSLSSAIHTQISEPRQTQTHFGDMAYVRPEPEGWERRKAEIAAMSESGSAQEILEAMEAVYDAQDDFYTAMFLADIYYSADLTDEYWAAEYDYCSQFASQISRTMEDIYRSLAASPQRRALESRYFGKGFFTQYDGESFWDDTVLALMDEEARLESRYHSLQSGYQPGSSRFYRECADDLVDVLVELIAVRQKIAAHCGYDSYPEYASDSYYYRDYTAAESAAYLEEIRQELVSLYRAHRDSASSGARCSEDQAMLTLTGAVYRMGGAAQTSLERMINYGLYDIAYSSNKYKSSFEVYLPSYDAPFLFMNPQRSRYDCLTLAHEFGHFCNDDVSFGSDVGIDVAEVFSQGMEYLLLCYGEDCGDLIRMKLADSLCTYVEQACYARFEMEMYALEGEDLNARNLCELFTRTVKAFGLDTAGDDSRDFVTIPHFYTNPMYIISYVVSNDAAMQLYAMELEAPGTGLDAWNQHLDTQEIYFLEFLESAGIPSPFEPGRISQVKTIFQNTLE